MKAKLIAVILVILLTAVGCSGNSPKTSDGKISEINTMMSKGYQMSDKQRQEISQAVSEAKKLLAENKKEDADRILDQTLNKLELIAETDRFNKSE